MNEYLQRGSKCNFLKQIFNEMEEQDLKIAKSQYQNIMLCNQNIMHCKIREN